MSIVTEIKSALVVLVVLHLTAFVVMVGYRMHTKQYYVSEAAKEAQATALLEAASQTNETLHNPLEVFEAKVLLLSKGISEAQASIDAYTQEAGRQMDLLNTLEQEMEQLTIQQDEDEGDEESSLDYWKDFLSVGSLKSIPDDDLQKFFDNAIQDIRTIGKGDSQNKLAKQFVSDTTFGAKVDKEPRTFACPRIDPVMDDDDLPVIQRKRPRPKDASYESDLEAYLTKFEAKFQNRVQANGIQALLPESQKEAQDYFEDRFELALDDIYEFASDLEERIEQDGGVAMASSSSSCDLDEDLIASMIAAGLDAQTAQSDVQEALRRSIREYDPSLSLDDLILDADLGGGGTCGSPPGIQSINLRSTIDTPLLIKSIEWIDVLVDAVGGYNDALDQYLDSLTGLHGTTSVGEILVEGILEQAGKVGDIPVDKYWKEAQDMIQAITGRRLN